MYKLSLKAVRRFWIC